MKISSWAAMSTVYAEATAAGGTRSRHSTRRQASNGGAPSPASAAPATREPRPRRTRDDQRVPEGRGDRGEPQHRRLPPPVGRPGQRRPAHGDAGRVRGDQQRGRAEAEPLPGEDQQRQRPGAQRQPADQARHRGPGPPAGRAAPRPRRPACSCGGGSCGRRRRSPSRTIARVRAPDRLRAGLLDRPAGPDQQRDQLGTRCRAGTAPAAWARRQQDLERGPEPGRRPGPRRRSRPRRGRRRSRPSGPTAPPPPGSSRRTRRRGRRPRPGRRPGRPGAAAGPRRPRPAAPPWSGSAGTRCRCRPRPSGRSRRWWRADAALGEDRVGDLEQPVVVAPGVGPQRRPGVTANTQRWTTGVANPYRRRRAGVITPILAGGAPIMERAVTGRTGPGRGLPAADRRHQRGPMGTSWPTSTPRTRWSTCRWTPRRTRIEGRAAVRQHFAAAASGPFGYAPTTSSCTPPPIPRSSSRSSSTTGATGRRGSHSMWQMCRCSGFATAGSSPLATITTTAGFAAARNRGRRLRVCSETTLTHTRGRCPRRCGMSPAGCGGAPGNNWSSGTRRTSSARPSRSAPHRRGPPPAGRTLPPPRPRPGRRHGDCAAARRDLSSSRLSSSRSMTGPRGAS